MVYLGEECLGVKEQDTLSLGVRSPGQLSPDEETEREVPEVMVMGLEKPSENLSLGRMSTAAGKERPVAAGDAGEAAVFPYSMRLQDF